MDFKDFDSQFAETEYETRKRWRQIKERRKSAGECWQCAKPVAQCLCPNLNHDSFAKMRETAASLHKEIPEDFGDE